MGWKTVKETYRIGHYVKVSEGKICIGSPYIHDIIVIGLDGKIVKGYRDKYGNEDLKRYQDEFDADPAKLAAAVAATDMFGESETVYTYKGGEIIECKCEEVGWPHVTHEGWMMYENTFSTRKETVVQWAKRDAEAGVPWRQERIKEHQADIATLEAGIAVAQANRAKLEQDYPETNL